MDLLGEAVCHSGQRSAMALLTVVGRSLFAPVSPVWRPEGWLLSFPGAWKSAQTRRSASYAITGRGLYISTHCSDCSRAGLTEPNRTLPGDRASGWGLFADRFAMREKHIVSPIRICAICSSANKVNVH